MNFLPRRRDAKTRQEKIDSEQERQKYIEIGHDVIRYKGPQGDFEKEIAHRVYPVNDKSVLGNLSDETCERLGRMDPTPDALVDYSEKTGCGIPVKVLNPDNISEAKVKQLREKLNSP